VGKLEAEPSPAADHRAADAARVRFPPLPQLVRLGLIAVLLGLAIGGWAFTDRRMAGMDGGPGTDPGVLGFYLVTWVVMMAAMMFPSIAPMVLTYARIQRTNRVRGAPVTVGATAVFVAGYLVSWTVAGLGFYGVLAAARASDLGGLSWEQGGRYVAGGVIVAAGLYQFTPLKQACLRKCRDPFMFLLTSWRGGRLGALRMGVKHGIWCVGCCWALMAALFALGIMSIGWMAFIAALIAIEKLLPWRRVANLGVAALLLVLGVSVVLVPEHVPGLTIPPSTDDHPVMVDM
jgi:predicted metal-binding membrane protein